MIFFGFESGEGFEEGVGVTFLGCRFAGRRVFFAGSIEGGTFLDGPGVMEGTKDS